MNKKTAIVVLFSILTIICVKAQTIEYDTIDRSKNKLTIFLESDTLLLSAPSPQGYTEDSFLKELEGRINKNNFQNSETVYLKLFFLKDGSLQKIIVLRGRHQDFCLVRWDTQN